MNLYLRPPVIAELAGLSCATIRRDVKRFKWKTKRHPMSRLAYYSLTEIGRTYGREWPMETIERVVAKYNRPAALYGD